MRGIVKPNAHDHALRVHARLAGEKTRCGRIIHESQEDIGPVNCRGCLKSLRRQLRSARRKLNGPRVKRGQMKFAIE
jgi:hypothetical protein